MNLSKLINGIHPLFLLVLIDKYFKMYSDMGSYVSEDDIKFVIQKSNIIKEESNIEDLIKLLTNLRKPSAFGCWGKVFFENKSFCNILTCSFHPQNKSSMLKMEEKCNLNNKSIWHKIQDRFYKFGPEFVRNVKNICFDESKINFDEVTNLLNVSSKMQFIKNFDLKDDELNEWFGFDVNNISINEIENEIIIN